MAHFYGTLRGNRGEASRLGAKASGLRTVAASWQGAVEVHLYHDEETGQDMASVSLIPWHGAGTRRDLFAGPVSGEPKARPKNACECSDRGCPVHSGVSQCDRRATVTLHRVDFAGQPKVRFCGDCAADALSSGVFGESR